MKQYKCKICKKVIKPQRKEQRPHWTGLCRKCWIKSNPIRGIKNPSWKGGRHKHKGYWIINLGLIKDEKLRKMAEETVRNRAYGKKRSGTIYEHSFVMIKKLGRPLKKDEEIHHLDGHKDNNDIDNLLLLDRTDHRSEYWALVRENALLKKELNRLKSSIMR